MTPNPNGIPLQADPRQLYEQLVASINGIVWEVDVATFLFTFVSQQAERLLGYPLEQWFLPGFWVDHLHPDDRMRSYEDCLQATREKRPHELVYRMIAADGRTVWLRDIVSVVVEGGVATKLRGIMVDVTEQKRAEEALRQREAELRLALEVGRLGEWSWDIATSRLTLSPFCKSLYGLPADADVTPERTLATVHPDDYAYVDAASKRAMETQSDYESEKRVIWPDGSVHWNIARGRVIYDDDGKPIRVTGVTIDITERKRAEAALRESEELFRLLAEKAPDPIMLLDEEGRPVYVSPAFGRLLGRNPPIGLFDDVHPEDLEATQLAWQQVWTKGEAFATYRIAQADGSWRILEGGGWRVQYKGKPHVLSVVRDVTDKRRAEEELRRSAAYLAEAQRLSKAGSWAWNVATREFVHWSQGHYILHRLNPQKGIPSWEEASQFIHPEDRARCLEAIERAVQEQTACEFEYRAILPDGSIKHIHSVAHPFFSETGELVEYVGTEMDVTESKRAEAALRESEQRYREVFNYSSECIFLIDVSPDGRFRFVAFNPTEEKAAGFASAEVTGKFIEDVLPAHLAAAVIPNYRRCIEAGKLISYDEELDLPTGRKSFHTTLIPVRDESGRIYRLIGIGHDVTATRRAEAELRRSEEMLRRAQGIGRVGSWVFDVEDGVFIGSEEGCRICGWEPGPHRGEELIALVHPDDLPRMQTAWLATLDGAPYEIEHRLVVDGKLRWVDVRAEPELDAEGRVTRITGVTQDITERKASEEALRASLREKDVLLKEVHHRVKNNLQLISSLLALQVGKMKDHAAAEAFAESQNRVRSIALVHENLYRTGDLASVRLAGHLESLCAHLLRSYNIDPDRIKLDLRVAEVTLDLDRSIRLGLLVNEVVSNVFKHAFPGERSGRVLVKLDMPRAGCYILVVSDNGVGLPPDLVPGHSDSLGLQLVADLTEQLSGTLGLDREGGTTFTIRFPARCQEDSRS